MNIPARKKKKNKHHARECILSHHKEPGLLKRDTKEHSHASSHALIALRPAQPPSATTKSGGSHGNCATAAAPGPNARPARSYPLPDPQLCAVDKTQTGRGENSTPGISWNVPNALPNTKNEKAYPTRGGCGWHRFHRYQCGPIKGLTILDDSWNTIAVAIISSATCGRQLRIKRRPHPAERLRYF